MRSARTSLSPDNPNFIVTRRQASPNIFHPRPTGIVDPHFRHGFGIVTPLVDNHTRKKSATRIRPQVRDRGECSPGKRDGLTDALPTQTAGIHKISHPRPRADRRVDDCHSGGRNLFYPRRETTCFKIAVGQRVGPGTHHRYAKP